MTDRVREQFNQLRVLIEGRAPGGATLVITSATSSDGTGFAAFGVASSFAASGQKTLLIRAHTTMPLQDTSPRETDDALSPRRVADSELFILDATEVAITDASSRDSVSVTLQRLRKEYPYVVVDAGALPKRSIATLLASVADITLIALRNGRLRSTNDKLLAAAISASEIEVLGIIATAKSAIEAFAQLDLPEESAKLNRITMGTMAASL